MKICRSIVLVGMLVGARIYAAEPTIEVMTTPRYPWSGMVDFAFTITGDSGMKFDTSFVAKDVVGGTNLPMRTIHKSDGSAAALTNSLTAGSYKWTWNAAADLPSNFVCDRVKVVGNTVAKQGLYMVIDLSGGSTATSYPVSYLDTVPSGGWTDVYKKSKMVLRRVLPGVYKMGSPSSEVGRYSNENLHQVTVTKPFYIGVFEVTQQQYRQVIGSSPTQYSNGAWPVGSVTWNAIRGNSETYNWPTSLSVQGTSFIGRMRSRTGFSRFDLPTEAQWEFACRAGTTTALNNGTNLGSTSDTSNLNLLARHWDNGGGTDGTPVAVGSYKPNAWGLYDMHGNVWEWCLDWWVENLGTQSVTDPIGGTSGSGRVVRGGSFWCVSGPRQHRSAKRGFESPSYVHNGHGFRMCLTVE